MTECNDVTPQVTPRNKVMLCFSCFFFFFFFFLFCFVFFFSFGGGGCGVTARQDYFTNFEPSQLLGGAKTGEPREKQPPVHPQAEIGLSHM